MSRRAGKKYGTGEVGVLLGGIYKIFEKGQLLTHNSIPIWGTILLIL